MKLEKIAKVFNCYGRAVCPQTAARLLVDKQPYQMYRIIVACVAMFMGVNIFAAPYVTNVVAKQRYPWNGSVDINFDIVGNFLSLVENEPEKGIYLQIEMNDLIHETKYEAAFYALKGDCAVTEGRHKVIWDLNVQGLNVVSSNVAFSVICKKTNKKYCVIDLSNGPTATSYPVVYIDDVPEGGWSDEYKTNKLVLRLIEPGAFKMQGQYDVTLTDPYYMGIFEITKKQCELIMGSHTSRYSGDSQSLDGASWNYIRGDSAVYNWPTDKTVSEESFVGRLRTRTGLIIDLPTEIQWEYACRAGTTTSYSYGDIPNDEYMWYDNNNGVGNKTVGTKLSNAWGLYDMHGSLEEWCLDWWGDLTQENLNTNLKTGDKRVTRGGSWVETANDCRSSSRSGQDPSYSMIGHFGYVGFRVVILNAK